MKGESLSEPILLWDAPRILFILDIVSVCVYFMHSVNSGDQPVDMTILYLFWKVGCEFWESQTVVQDMFSLVDAWALDRFGVRARAYPTR